MNTTQLHYFLTAARCLNFTKAARQLFISQPALSKQITAIESDLNMQLFIRTPKALRLTPAGAVLLRELPDFEAHYDRIIEDARAANEGNAGTLTIGILEGQMVGADFTDKYAAFTSRYSNISVRLLRNSFSGLRQQLRNGDIDLAITLDFDIAQETGLLYDTLASCPAMLAVSRKNTAIPDQIANLSDLSDQTFIIVDEKDSIRGPQMVIAECKRFGFTPHIRRAPSLETVMLWIEAGMGIGVINAMNNLTLNPQIRLLTEIPLGDTQTVLAWNKDNINPTIPLFCNYSDPVDVC